MGLRSRLNHWDKYEKKEVFESIKATVGKSTEHNTVIVYGRLFALTILVSIGIFPFRYIRFFYCSDIFLYRYNFNFDNAIFMDF